MAFFQDYYIVFIHTCTYRNTHTYNLLRLAYGVICQGVSHPSANEVQTFQGQTGTATF